MRSSLFIVVIALILAFCDMRPIIGRKKSHYEMAYPDPTQKLNDQKTDFEIFKISQDQSKDQFILKTIDMDRWGQHLTGSLLILKNPTLMGTRSSLNSSFSVLTTSKQGCGHLERTSTAAMKNYDCIAATNAGFFDMRSGGCIGNLIIDGKLVEAQNSVCSRNPQNAAHSSPNFAILNDKTYLLGYLTDSDVQKAVAEKKIFTMMSGITWLIRNNEMYVNQSRNYEGVSQSFINLIAPRVAIGHNSQGHLMVLEIDGYEPSKWGVNLYQFATIFKELGAVNAINVDGGGSSTVYFNGKVLSSCSDACVNPGDSNLCPNAGNFKCERKVSTFFCLRF